MKHANRPPTWAAALTAALLLPAMSNAQETATDPQQHHGADVTVALVALNESGVEGEIVIRPEHDEMQEMSTEAQPIELNFSVRGLEAEQQIRLLVHRGPCSDGTTTVTEVGTYTADGEGQINETVTVSSEEFWQALQGEPTQETMEEETSEETEEAPEEMTSADAFHLQIESNGQPLACGNFEQRDM